MCLLNRGLDWDWGQALPPPASLAWVLAGVVACHRAQVIGAVPLGVIACGMTKVPWSGDKEIAQITWVQSPSGNREVLALL